MIRRLPSGRWQAVYRDPTGAQRSLGSFQTKRLAQAALAGRIVGTSQGRWVDPESGKVTLQRFVDQRWLPALTGEVTTRAAVKSRLHAHVLPRFGSWPLRSIAHLDVQEWVNDLARRLSPETIASCLGVLRSILQAAVKDGRLGYDPCLGVKLPARRRGENNTPTATDVERLIQATDLRWRAAVGVAAWAGLRWGEVAGLTRRSVDWTSRSIHVTQVAVEVSGHVSVKKYPKSKRSQRVVPLPSRLADLLLDHLAQDLDSDLVFTDTNGGPLRRGNFRRRVWLPACQKTEVSCRFHDLRHFYASDLLGRGVPVTVVSELMGHENVSTTLNRYAWAMPDQMAAVRSLLDADPT